ncbi:hypothetical protein AK88_05440 [Plasmodium fragile]|uniref:Uncharacterized protein n=1 Tax=Plasmodium fragile TaxID=5857 RepID=A0A0D9QGT0_PLAFR|nr:uncharacterized protein AK88_05440 [Plasmodium fragile]KJP84931.1 hypothetical protein AK88_05440 [Plasmodium fragile]
MSAANLAQLLAQWVREAGISDQHEYEDMVWAKTKEVMAEFVHYMQRDDILLYAANCGNTGWDHPDFPSAPDIYLGQTVGDKIVCVLMVGALFFMNGWSGAKPVSEQEDDTSARITEHLRCIIAHMFSAVLNESVCPARRGTSYAWRQMEGMDTGTDSFPPGLIKNGRCGREKVAHLQIRDLELNAEVKKWLGQNSTLKEAIQKLKGGALCSTLWKDTWNLQEMIGNGKTEDTSGLQIAPIVEDLKAGMIKLFTEIGKQAADSIEKRKQEKKGKLANDGTNAEAATTQEGTTPPPQEQAGKIDGEKALIRSHTGSHGPVRTVPI